MDLIDLPEWVELDYKIMETQFVFYWFDQAEARICVWNGRVRVGDFVNIKLKK